MSAKRRPGTDLNHDNWDNDEEPEEVGEFRKASADELKNRVIKVAKRRNKIGGDETPAASTATSNVFKSFSGFGNVNSKPTSSPFSSLLLSSASTTTTTTATTTKELNGTKSATTTEHSGNDEKSTTYYAKLKGLNQTVASWITKHVNENALCILTPIFDDYARFLKEIEATSNDKSSTETGKSKHFTFTSAAVTTSPKTAATSQNDLLFGAAKKPETSSSLFSFSSSTTSLAAPAPSSSLTFGSSSTTTSSGFSFGSSATPFTFANVKKPEEHKTDATVKSSDANGDDDIVDEPPKVEFTPVVEEDNLYSIRCKVYVKTKNEYGDRGVGTLYIKSVEDGKKTQLIVRADTNIGNILLNILLTDAVPASRMGKNNVMLMCLPTPDAKPPAVAVLVRVKDAAEADQLLAEINKTKK